MEGIVIAAALVVALVLALRYGVQRRNKGPGTPGAETPMPERSQENQMRAAEGPTHHGPVDEGPVYRHEDAEARGDEPR
jgi:hypothetical protein